MSEKNEKVCRALSYFEPFLILILAGSGCASTVGAPVGIASSAVRLKFCAIAAGIVGNSK